MFLLHKFRHHEIRDWPEIMKDKTLNVVTEFNSTYYFISGDSIVCFQYELCKYIGTRSGLSVRIFSESNFDLCIKGLQNNTYDIIAINIPVTAETKKHLLFTIPITIGRYALIQREPDEKDSAQVFVHNQIGLANKTVYVSQNSAAIPSLQNLSEEIAEPVHIREVPEHSSETLIYMVYGKEIDYAVVDKALAEKVASKLSGIDYSIDIGFNQLQAWAMRMSSPVLSDSLNVWISEFMGK